MKALYDYRAQRFDELSFCKHAIITNVTKHKSGWWRGDYGGKRQHWFPANFVHEMTENESLTDTCSSDGQWPPSNPRKGCVHLEGATVAMCSQAAGGYRKSIEHCFQITLAESGQCFRIGSTSQPEATEWAEKIAECCRAKSSRKVDEKERNCRIAQELSNLIVYCRAVPFDPERIGNFTEMSSFPETKLEKWLSPSTCPLLLAYNQRQFTRVYPKGARIDSSNYDPLRMWNMAVQMAALNYQTADRAMQINHAKFAYQNGGCGYVLKPLFMFEKSYNPYDVRSVIQLVQPWTVTIQVISARHLTKLKGRGVISPFVEVEMLGTVYDSMKFKTTTISKFD